MVAAAVLFIIGARNRLAGGIVIMSTGTIMYLGQTLTISLLLTVIAVMIFRMAKSRELSPLGCWALALMGYIPGINLVVLIVIALMTSKASSVAS